MSDLTLTNGELLEARGPIAEIGAYDIPDVKGSYAFTKIIRRAQSGLEDIEAARIKLCEKHTPLDDDGKHLKNERGEYAIADMTAFNADWKQLMAETVTLAGCRPITIDELAGATRVVRDDKGKVLEIVRGIRPHALFSLGPILAESAPGPDAPQKE